MKKDVLKRLERIEGGNKHPTQNVIMNVQATVDGAVDITIDPIVQKMFEEYYKNKDNENHSKAELERTSNIIL